jgi:2-succinyl-5-enolpyruvyl-6-hydroxy-3-cyclohexene-1-carboxylate synthase
LVPILDERSAGFFALGAARASGRPVALLATSGSAPAHWYPAVIEASETGVPLILLCADRPPALRGFGANQTIDQTRLFGAFARESHDPGLPHADPPRSRPSARSGRAAALSPGPRPGPVQINLPFAEPLVPAPGTATRPCRRPSPHPPRTSAGHQLPPNVALEPIPLPPGRGVVVCGPGLFVAGFAQALQHAARRLALPVLADPLSGLRFGPAADGVITQYDALLRNPQAAAGAAPGLGAALRRRAGVQGARSMARGIPALLVDPAGGWRTRATTCAAPNHRRPRRRLRGTHQRRRVGPDWAAELAQSRRPRARPRRGTPRRRPGARPT